jgi:drug/metabolite transporter (DMT)-like permease
MAGRGEPGNVIAVTSPVTRAPGRWVPAYAALAVIWGLSFLFIKVADRAFAPVQVAFGRVVLGCAVVCALAALRGRRLPRSPRVWLYLMAAAALMNTVPFTLLAYGEQRISSVSAGLWNATTPLLAIPATIWLIPAERPGARRLAGLAIGFAGVLILLGGAPRLDAQTLAGDALCFGAACSYGVGFPFTRRFLSATGLDPVVLAAGQLVCATIQLAIVAALLTPAPAGLPAAAVLSVLALGAAGTGLAYILTYRIITAAGATVASTITYVIPICSTAAGALILSEHLTAVTLAGAALIISGAVGAQERGVTRNFRRRER